MKIMTIALMGINILFGSSIQAQEYSGSSFSEVWDVVQNKNFIPQSDSEKQEFNVYKLAKLPQYPVNAKSVFLNGEIVYGK